MPTFTGGLGSQLGIANETTYGTIVTPAKFLEYMPGETMTLSRAFVLSQQLRAGRSFTSSTRRTATTRSAAGALTLEVPNQGFGPLLNLLHGETVTPTKESSSTIYKQVHNIGTTDPFKKSITLQLGKPTVEGVVSPFTYPGTILNSMVLSCQTGGWLTSALTLDSQDEQTGTALATASYPTSLQGFNFTQCVVKVNSVEQKAVRGITITINKPTDVARYYLGATKKAVPLTNAYAAATIALTVDYKDETLYKLFEKGEVVPVEITFTGETVETIVTELKFKFEACGLDGDSPNVANLGPLQQNIPLTVLDNNSVAPVVATYVSKDTAL